MGLMHWHMEDACCPFHRDQPVLQCCRHASTHRWPDLRHPALGIGHHWRQTELYSCAAKCFRFIFERANHLHNALALGAHGGIRRSGVRCGWVGLLCCRALIEYSS